MKTRPIPLKELKHLLKEEPFNEGYLFCFGSSFISKLIQAKTKLYPDEIVPSHVAMIRGGFLYESTSGTEKVGAKHIPAGVRRWLLSDFFKSEKKKDTLYIFIPYSLDVLAMNNYIHLPYGKDTIVDYLLKDKSNGDSRGLICSQYANLCGNCKPLNVKCCTPAELFRECLRLMELDSSL